VTNYPSVLSEVETMDLVVAGRSVARYGDGEFKMALGSSIKSQERHPALALRLRQILQQSGQCLVGIPNIHSATPKSVFWRKFLNHSSLLADRPYVSAFITRPDSAPWIDTEAYWAKVQSLWLGREVTLVRGSSKSLTADVLNEAGAGHVTEVVAARQHAWVEYDELLERIGRPERALLCLGPTATVMAVDLCARGVHAIDLGHIGMFWKKHTRGEQMWVSDEDKVAVV
jgi:hypothetical protein